ncbi:MAG: hypothetical protein FWF04_04785, partial [Clostridiales bacterium]|nr:hypothetical protein [Clostridiales bacterium]
MKTFIKAVLIIGCTLFLVGLLLAMFGLALGGRPDIIAIRLDDMGVTHNITAYGNKYFVNRDHDFNWDNSFYDDWDTYKQPEDEDESGASGNLFEPFAAALPQAGYYDISRLEFRFGAGDINIVGGDSFELIYGNDFSRNFFYERHDADTWTIGSSRRNWGWLNGWRYGRDTLKLTIVLPYDFVAEYAVIEMGAGNLQARQLYAR